MVFAFRWILLFAPQAFTPELPPAVPAVSGTVVDRAVFRSIDTLPGTGQPALPGQEYKVHYTGWLRDGSKFDSSVDRQEPFVFIQGRRQVIAGWDSGFEGMRVGGRRRLFIPYPLAYGEAGRGAIPPKAELIFDVELLAVRNVAPEQPALDVLLVLAANEKKLLALARAIPEEKYSFRPVPGVRSLAEVLHHVAAGNRILTALAAPGQPAPAAAAPPPPPSPQSKAALLAALEESFQAARRQLEPLRPGQLGREATLLGDVTTVRGVYISLAAHVAEHLGQLIAYARMQSITPPWSDSPR